MLDFYIPKRHKVFYKTQEKAHSEMINSIFLKYSQSNGSTTI